MAGKELDIDIDDFDLELEDEEEIDEPEVPQSEFEVFDSLEREQEFNHWCEEEIHAANSERSPLLAKLRDWRKIANNIDVSGRQPAWDGASDINVPVIPIILKTATARLRNTFNTRSPFWSIKPLNMHSKGPWIKRAEVLEKYFNIISNSRYDLNLYAKSSLIMTDLPIAATVWVRIPYMNLTRNIAQEGFDENNQSLGTTMKSQVVKSGPEIDVIRTENIIYRDNVQDIQMAPFFGVKQPLTWYEVKLLENSDGWVNVDQLKDEARTSQNDYEQVDSELRNTFSAPAKNNTNGLFDIIELWAYYDVNGDGQMEDVLAYYHLETKTLLAVKYNQLGMRPIRNIPFYMKPYSLEGQGVVELSEHLQQEVNGLHNLRNDGIRMTEAPVWAARRGSGLRPNESIYPGKILWVNNPGEDVKLLQNTKQYIETDKLETMDYSYMERATGISDISGGFSSQMLKSRDTASSQNLRMQAGSEVFMGIIEGVDLAFQDMAEMIYRQLVANREDVIEKERKAQRLSEEDIDILEETFDVDIDTIPYALAFKARISEGIDTFEGKRQSILSLVTIYTQFVTQIIPLIHQTYPANPQTGQPNELVAAMMKKFVEGATALMEKVFVFFGEEDTQQYMISSDRIEMMNDITQKMQGNMAGLQGIGAASGQQLPQKPQGGEGQV